MNTLNKICSYWYDCIKREDTQSQEISINADSSKSALCPFSQDTLIFNKKDDALKTSDAKILEVAKQKEDGIDIYYGYPLLYYKDWSTKKDLVAPLLMIKLKLEQKDDELTIRKDEANPTCGAQALLKLGLQNEEIVKINEEVAKLYTSNPKLDQQNLANQVLQLIKKDVTIAQNEEIIINQLTNSVSVSHAMTAALYNKSIIFASEERMYNIHLIKDLWELKDTEASVLEETALSFITGAKTTRASDKHIPILPFPANEYQVAGLQNILTNSLSVITGPPGTGKSQFISNLIINLFLANKSVLFVSHTGEAVNVVYNKLNEPFENLMLRTGSKGFRKELPSKYNQLIQEHATRGGTGVSLKKIHFTWNTMLDYKNQLIERDELEQTIEENFFMIKELKEIMSNSRLSFKYLINWIKVWLLNRKFNANKRRLASGLAKHDLENKLKELEEQFYADSRSYVKTSYLKTMIGEMENKEGIISFIDRVSTRRQDEEDKTDEKLVAATLNALKVWACTLKSLRATFPLQPAMFDYVIFDEASQVDLPSAVPALYRAKNAIIVGDPKQLTHIATIPPKIDRQLAKLHGLSALKELYPSKIGYNETSLYQAAEISAKTNPMLLRNHYRSDDEIISLCNQVFYGGKLKILSSLDYKNFPTDLPQGIEWVDVKGQTDKLERGSKVNNKEVEKVCSVFEDVLKKVSGTDLSIGIVTPYTGQTNIIAKRIEEIAGEKRMSKHKIQICTAHKFQGSEKDIMIFSQVLASSGDGNDDRWYNSCPQILNVALSRARYLLYIVGDKSYCQSRKANSTLNKVITAHEKIKARQDLEEQSLGRKFDSPTERLFYEQVRNLDLNKYGYELVPKFIAKRYTLDFALIGGGKRIDIEIDGTQHEIIKGMPALEDVERDAFLKEKGWEVMRIPNSRVLTEMEDVMKEILRKIKPRKEGAV